MNHKTNLFRFLNGIAQELRENSAIALTYLAIVVPFGTLAGYLNPGDGEDFFNLGLTVDQALLPQGALAAAVQIGSIVLGLIAYYWLVAGMTLRTASPGFDRILPFIGIYILSWIGIGFGILLFVIPGIYLAVRWVAVLPLLITRQDYAMDAFGDSDELTQGYGWSLVGTALICALVLMALAIVTEGLATVLAGGGSFATALSASVFENVTALVYAAFTVTVYRQLAPKGEEMAQVFE